NVANARKRRGPCAIRAPARRRRDLPGLQVSLVYVPCSMTSAETALGCPRADVAFRLLRKRDPKGPKARGIQRDKLRYFVHGKARKDGRFWEFGDTPEALVHEVGRRGWGRARSKRQLGTDVVRSPIRVDLDRRDVNPCDDPRTHARLG